MREYSVASLMAEVDRGITDRYPRLLVEGEVAQLTVAASGHAYMVLREPGTQRTADTLSGICWKSVWSSLATRPKPGDRVVCRGKLGVYTQRGQIQMTIQEIRPAGAGALARQIAERIERLKADGLLDPARKRPLPAFPRFVGVVASPTSAAVQDFLRVSGERYPAARILIAPAITQGAEAPSSVARAIDLLLEDGRAEVIVITRGGGSKEDLMAFQDEQLARLVARLSVPTVSAVGHQIDTTLLDLVADVAVPTPTAAAVAVLPDGPAMVQTVDDVTGQLHAAMARRLGQERQRLVALQARLRHPGDRLAEVSRARVALQERLERAMSRYLLDQRQRVDHADRGLISGIQRQIATGQTRLATQSAALSALSPLAVLSRGYAVVRSDAGVVTEVSSLAVGDTVTVRLSRGSFTSRVLRLAGDE